MARKVKIHMAGVMRTIDRGRRKAKDAGAFMSGEMESIEPNPHDVQALQQRIVRAMQQAQEAGRRNDFALANSLQTQVTEMESELANLTGRTKAADKKAHDCGCGGKVHDAAPDKPKRKPRHIFIHK